MARGDVVPSVPTFHRGNFGYRALVWVRGEETCAAPSLKTHFCVNFAAERDFLPIFCVLRQQENTALAKDKSRGANLWDSQPGFHLKVLLLEGWLCPRTTRKGSKGLCQKNGLNKTRREGQAELQRLSQHRSQRSPWSRGSS